MPLINNFVNDVRIEREDDVFSLRIFFGEKRIGSCTCVVTGFESLRVKNLVVKDGGFDATVFYGLLSYAKGLGYSRIEYERKKGTSFFFKSIDLNDPKITKKFNIPS